MSLSMPTIGMHASLPIPVPVELLQCILQQIDDCQTLSLLALVCRVFYLEANMILYRSPRNIKPLRHIQFLSSLVGNPRLACLVRSYKLPFIAGKQRITYLELLRITLPLMVNLKELSIMAAANEIEVLSVARLTIQIENVSWIQLDSGQNDQFVRWAQSQKSTKHLRWIHKKAVEVPRSAFPSLVSLEGNLHVVEALMPDRDIRRLHWIADSLSGEFLVTKALAVKMENLKSLTFEIRFNAVDYNTIAGYFHSLTFLELVGSFRKSDMEIIPIPPTLRILVFSANGIRDIDAVLQPQERSDAISHIFERATNLFRIDITSEKREKSVLYERWEQCIRNRDLVHSDIVHESCRYFSASPC